LSREVLEGKKEAERRVAQEQSDAAKQLAGWCKDSKMGLQLSGRPRRSSITPNQEPTMPEPFSLRLSPTEFEKLNFNKHGGTYTVSLNAPELKKLNEAGMSSFGRITPLRAVTLSESEKEVARIPRDATLFAWAFPLSLVAGDSPLKPESAEEKALVNGAYAYFKDADTLVGLNSVELGKGLNFQGPNLLSGRPSLRTHLKSTSRCTPVTIDAYKQIGVEEFFWLGPCEEIPSQKIGVEEIPGVAGDEWPHGAFVYLFSEKHKDKDCFFKCQPA